MTSMHKPILRYVGLISHGAVCHYDNLVKAKQNGPPISLTKEKISSLRTDVFHV